VNEVLAIPAPHSLKWVSARHSEGLLWYTVRVRVWLGLAIGGPSLWRPQTLKRIPLTTDEKSLISHLW